MFFSWPKEKMWFSQLRHKFWNKAIRSFLIQYHIIVSSVWFCWYSFKFKNVSLKKDGYDKKLLGEIGKRESENDVVWITLQDRQFKWKKVTIPKVKEDGTDLIYILYANTNHREKFFKPDTVQDKE